MSGKLRTAFLVIMTAVFYAAGAHGLAFAYTTYTVQPGDYLVLISMKYNVSWQGIAQLNNLSSPYTIYPNQVLLIPPSHCLGSHDLDDCYKVVHGDTLYKIGLRYHVSWQYIAQLNGITPPYLIYPGETLYIPDHMDLAAEVRSPIILGGYF